MSLQFIVGGAGSGKSTYLYEWVTEEAALTPRENFLVIVPEQFTLHTQQALVACSPRGSILNIDVLSFDRLAYRIFDELGASTQQVLEDTGKYMLLAHVAQRCSEDLTVLRYNIRRPGTISQIKSLFSEFMQYAISPEDLEEMATEHKGPQSFYAKAKDLSLLYGDYMDALTDTYITAEEVLSRLTAIAADSAILSGATVVFDGFTGFTPVQYQFLQQLLPLASRVVVTVNCDPQISLFSPVVEQELFAMSKTMVQRLSHMAETSHTEVIEPVLLTENHRFIQGGMLAHLESQLFRPQPVAYTGGDVGDEISLVSLRDVRQELTWIGCEILRQVRTENMRYSDFAIACADLDSYAYLIPGIFDSLGIPYFLDATSTIEFHPLTECIKALFMVFDERFSYESVLRLLRTGLLGFRTEEIDRFENYILATNLHGILAYRTPLSFVPKDYSVEDVAALEEIRVRFATPILAFLDQFPRRRGSGRQITTALYEWVISYDMETQLLHESERLLESGDEREARIYERIYGLMMDLFDKLVMLLGDEEFTFRDYARLLETGMEALTVGVIPGSFDQVVIGDLERSRLSGVSVLYVAGACDGAIPKTSGNGGLLSEQERRVLKEQGYELAPTEREKAFMQRFYLYFVMTQPSRKLCISYARLDTSGKSTIRSYIYGTIEQLFPEMRMQQILDLSKEQQFLVESLAKRYMAKSLREYALSGTQMDENYITMLAREDDETNRYLDAAFYTYQNKPLHSEMVDALFGHEIKESVSRIENYQRCAYAFFLKYGLRLEKRLEYGFEPVDLGNLYHDALNFYARAIAERDDLDWQTITEDQMHEILSASIQKAYDQIDQKEIMTAAREQFLFFQVENTLVETVWALTEQVRHGFFVPRRFEVQLDEVGDEDSFIYELDKMHKMRLRGKIDRIDLCENEDLVYVKIVDYKSSDKQLKLDDLYAGIQVQLVLYMDAAVRGLQQEYSDKEVRPAAMFYSHVYQGVPDVSVVNPEKLDVLRKTLQSYKSKGYVVGDLAVVDALDTGVVGYSDVIPVYATNPTDKKERTLSEGSSSILSQDEFSLLSRHVRSLVLSTGQHIVAGDFPIAPVVTKDTKACRYCEYHSVCGFDWRLDGFEYRTVPKMTDDEVFTQIRKDLGKEDA